MSNQVSSLEYLTTRKIVLEGLDTSEESWLSKQEYLRDFLPGGLTSILSSQMMQMLLGDRTNSEEIRLACVKIFLNSNTEYFNFGKIPMLDSTIQSILSLIPIRSPNITMIDFTDFPITFELKQAFEILLIQCTHLNALYLRCYPNICGIWDLLINTNNIDGGVLRGLRQVEHLILTTYTFINPVECAKILSLCPRLKSFGPDIYNLGKGITTYIRNYATPDTKLGLEELYDDHTSLVRLREFSQYCPKIKLIRLYKPEAEVVANLVSFRYLKKVELIFFNFSEVMHFSQNFSGTITKLTLGLHPTQVPDFSKIDFLKQYYSNRVEIYFLDPSIHKLM